MTETSLFTLTIRRYDYTTDSIIELTKLLNRAYKVLADMGLKYWATWQGPEITLDRIKDKHCFVGLLNDRIVSTIAYKPHRLEVTGEHWYDKSFVAHISQFGVEPELQKKGIGSQIMDFIEDYALQLGTKELALDTAEPAIHLIKWYNNRGYRFIEHVQWDKVNYRSVILSKTIL